MCVHDHSPVILVAGQSCDIRRIGLLHKPLKDLGGVEKALLIAEAYGVGALRTIGRLPLKLIPFVGRPKRLTETYLADPALGETMVKARAKLLTSS